jgi:hypothetical protein
MLSGSQQMVLGDPKKQSLNSFEDQYTRLTIEYKTPTEFPQSKIVGHNLPVE